jgi:hypothetical protein
MTPQLSARNQLLLLWLVISALGVWVCSFGLSMVHIGGEYFPLGNDSFYHARRILDTARDPSSFYQFDPKIHAPDGSYVVWPWGYDYVLGWLVRLGMMTGITADPMALLAWVPPAAVIVSVAMMMLIARRLSLSMWSTAIAGLCVAVAPLTPVLHGVGMIDHHWAEYIFVLASMALGLRWFLAPEKVAPAAALGVLLGTATAVHNGLFILQIPVLAFVFLRWLQEIRLERRAALYFGVALITATLLVLIPSLAFRDGLFQFYTLSWFHLYVAAATAGAVVLMSVLPFTKRNLLILALIGLALVVPMLRQIYIAQAFLAGTIKRLDVIAEMQSPRQMAARAGGITYVSSMYTLFVWLLPLTLGYSAFRAWGDRSSARLFFWICAICGLVLLLMQFRLHYYGSFALFLPWLVLIEDLARKWEPKRKVVMLAASLAFLLMFASSLRYSIPAALFIGTDENFEPSVKVLRELGKVCEKEPGVVLADSDAGHLIRYFTSCSVIADSFLLTKEDVEKTELVDHLMGLPADEMPAAATYVRYVFLRPLQIIHNRDGVTYVSYSSSPRPTLMGDLLLKPLPDVSPRYKLLAAEVEPTADPANPLPYVRLFEVLPGPRLPSTSQRLSHDPLR